MDALEILIFCLIDSIQPFFIFFWFFIPRNNNVLVIRYDHLSVSSRAREEKRKETELQIRLGNINYNPDVKPEPFMSWEQFKEFWTSKGFKPTIEQYKEEKAKYLKGRRQEIQSMTHLEKIVFNVPVDPNTRDDCIKYRRMRLGFEPLDSFFIQNHITCRWCEVWFIRNKDECNLPKGVNLWEK